MKILHIIDRFEPQFGYQETHLAKKLVKLGNDVFIIASIHKQHDSIIACQLFHPRESEDGYKILRMPILFSLMGRVWMIGLERKIRELRPDVVHVHNMNNITAFRIALLKRRFPCFRLIYDEHILYEVSRNRLKVLYPLLKRTALRFIDHSADSIVAVTDETKRFMIQKFGISKKKIRVIPLGADHRLFRFEKQWRIKVREGIGIGCNDVVFIYAGRIVPENGCHILVDAALEILSNNKQFKVLIVGNGCESYIKGMKDRISTKGFGGNFIWHKRVPNRDLFKLYSAADISVWPSGVSIGMFEAMSCSLPLIVDDSLAAEERIKFNNALIFRRENVQDLARQMTILFDDPQLKKTLGKNGRNIVEKKFNWEKIAKEFLEEYVNSY